MLLGAASALSRADGEPMRPGLREGVCELLLGCGVTLNTGAEGDDSCCCAVTFAGRRVGADPEGVPLLRLVEELAAAVDAAVSAGTTGPAGGDEARGSNTPGMATYTTSILPTATESA